MNTEEPPETPWGDEVSMPRKNRLVDIPDTMPQDLDAERSFLATVGAPGGGTAHEEAVVEADPQDFVGPAHKAVLTAMQSLQKKGLEINSLTIKSEMVVAGTIGLVGGFPGIVDLLSGDDVEKPKVLLQIIQEKARLRRLIHLGSSIVKTASTDGDASRIAMEISRSLGTLLAGFATTDTPIRTHAELFDLAAAGKPLLPPNLSCNKPIFGVPFLDSSFVATPRRFGVIAAKTSAGKSSIAYQICVNTCSAGRRVLLVSLESDPEEVVSAMAGNMGHLNRGDIIKHGTKGFAHTDLEDVKKNFSAYYASSGSSWETIERAVRAEHRERPFDVVLVDYFTLLQPPDYKGRNLASQYGEISKAGKRLAQELECSVIFLSQFNRGVEDGVEPFLENLRETGQLEQDADWVMLMWANPIDEQDGTRIVHAKGAKNRGGKRNFRGSMTFYPDQSRFEEKIGYTMESKFAKTRRMQ